MADARLTRIMFSAIQDLHALEIDRPQPYRAIPMRFSRTRGRYDYSYIRFDIHGAHGTLLGFATKIHPVIVAKYGAHPAPENALGDDVPQAGPSPERVFALLKAHLDVVFLARPYIQQDGRAAPVEDATAEESYETAILVGPDFIMIHQAYLREQINAPGAIVWKTVMGVSMSARPSKRVSAHTHNHPPGCTSGHD